MLELSKISYVTPRVAPKQPTDGDVDEGLHSAVAQDQLQAGRPFKAFQRTNLIQTSPERNVGNWKKETIRLKR